MASSKQAAQTDMQATMAEVASMVESETWIEQLINNKSRTVYKVLVSCIIFQNI